MNRKIIALILTGIISVLLITGCSSQTESAGGTDAEKTQESAQEETATVLPADAKIGIAYTEGSGEFTSFFIVKAMSNLVAAGVPEGNIEKIGGSGEELAANAQKLIDSQCSALMIGNANEENAPGITDAAVKANIPVVYFGTSPGEAEIARWEKEGLRAAYAGSSYDQSAEKRADLIDSADMEKIDLNEDGEIGFVVLYSGEDKAGDQVNRDTVRILEERGTAVYELTQDDEEEASEEESEEAEETVEKEADTYDETARENAREQVIEWMTDYGKQLEVIICADDMQALGAWDAVSEEKKRVGHDVLIMGFDSNTESLEEVAAGNIRSSFFNDFMEQSKNASDAVLAYLKGIEVQRCAMSEYVSVTVDNAQEILDISMKTQENDPDSDTEENTEEE